MVDDKKKRYRNPVVNVYPDVYQTIKDISESTNKDMLDIVSEAVRLHFAKQQFISEYFPNFHKLHVVDNSVLIKDTKRDRIIEVVVKDGNIRCTEDNTDSCIHTNFVLALPEVAQAWKNRKFEKKPSQELEKDAEIVKKKLQKKANMKR